MKDSKPLGRAADGHCLGLDGVDRRARRLGWRRLRRAPEDQFPALAPAVADLEIAVPTPTTFAIVVTPIQAELRTG